MTNKGILLGIVSKNDEALALEVVNQHPEMILREKILPDDVSIGRIKRRKLLIWRPN